MGSLVSWLTLVNDYCKMGQVCALFLSVCRTTLKSWTRSGVVKRITLQLMLFVQAVILMRVTWDLCFRCYFLEMCSYFIAVSQIHSCFATIVNLIQKLTIKTPAVADGYIKISFLVCCIRNIQITTITRANSAAIL